MNEWTEPQFIRLVFVCDRQKSLVELLSKWKGIKDSTSWSPS